MSSKNMRKALLQTALVQVAAMAALSANSAPAAEVPVAKPPKRPMVTPTVHVNKHGKILGAALKGAVPTTYADLSGNTRKGKGERKRTAWRVK